MSIVNYSGALSSFRASFCGNEVELEVGASTLSVPPDADVVQFEQTDNEIPSVDDVNFASIDVSSTSSTLRITGFYLPPSHDIDETSSGLFLATADSLRIANFEEAQRVAVYYNGDIPGSSMDHIPEIISGIRWYLRFPTTNILLAADAGNSIEKIFLVLNAGAVRVWKERFAPHAGKQNDLWLVCECLRFIKELALETSWKRDLQETADTMRAARFTNFKIERTMKRVADFARAENPHMDEGELREICETVYALHLRINALGDLEAKAWTSPTKNAIRNLIREHQGKNTSAASVKASGEIASVLRELQELAIPEFMALDASLQNRVAARFVEEYTE